MIFLRCPVQLCGGRRMRHHLTCKECWKRLPRWLRDAIAAERDSCRQQRLEHTQELLALRDQAVAVLSDRNRRRFEKPKAAQLALIT